MFLIILRGFPYNHHIFWIIFSAAMFFFPFPFFQVSAPGETFVNAPLRWTGLWCDDRGNEVFHQQTNVPLDQWQATTLLYHFWSLRNDNVTFR